MSIDVATKIYADVLAVHASLPYACRMTDLAQTIRDFRIGKGLTQGQLADALKTKQENVSRWENGSKPKPDALRSLAALMGVTVDALIAGTDNEATDAAPVGHLMLPVLIPSESSLIGMFEAMLEGYENLSRADIARRLAQGLPIGLQQALGRPRLTAPGEALIPGVDTQHSATLRPEAQ